VKFESLANGFEAGEAETSDEPKIEL